MKNTVYAMILTAVVIIVIVVAWLLFRPKDGLVDACVQALPGTEGLTSAVELSGDRWKFDVKAGRDRAGATPELLEKFTDCLRAAAEARGTSIVIVNGVDIPKPLPIGQVADQWSDDKGGFYVDLRPSDQESVQNLRIGPAAAPKPVVIAAWCQENADCVSCDSRNVSNDRGTVVVALKDKAPMKKVLMSEGWPVPNAKATPRPWQLVDSDGRRYFYECRR